MLIALQCYYDKEDYMYMPILQHSYNAFTPIHYSHVPATFVFNMFKISVVESWSFRICPILLRPYHVHEDPFSISHNDTTIGHNLFKAW